MLLAAAHTADMAPQKQVPALVPGSSSRPANTGKSAALDVAIQRKLTSNLPGCRTAGVDCVPMIVETLEGGSEEAINIIGSVSHLQRQILDIPTAGSISHLFQRLAIPLWQGNAILWLLRQLSQ